MSRLLPGAPTARLAIAAMALAIAAAVLACGNGGPGSQPTSPTPDTGTQPPRSTPAPGGGTPAVCGLDLATETPDATVFGADAGDFLADRFSLATGDFNGDGRDDILIGAPLADGPDDGRSDAGEAYVIFGSPDLDGAIDLAKGEAGLTVYGDNPGGNMGFTVASGDVNGDGVDDVLVGARFAGPEAEGSAGEGEVYVMYGRSDLGGKVDIAVGDQDTTVVGAESGDFLGIALASGDVNGDGVSDLILGASGADGIANHRKDAGEVYVVLGSADLASRIELGDDRPYFTVEGSQPGDLMPNYLAAGDVDGDGRAELVVGAPSAGRATVDEQPPGEAYVIDVPDSPGSELDLADGQGYTRVRGAAALDGLGFFVTAADVNGDGRDDVIIGARDADGPDNGRNNAGEVHLLFGEEDLPGSIDLAETALDVTISGADSNDSLGFTVASGDVNGDGTQDLLAGAPLGDGCGNRVAEAGDAYVLFGRPEWPQAIDLAEGGYDMSVFGAEEGDELGFSLTAGDIDGDGRDDILAGALQADGPDNGREDGGEAYLIRSR